MIDPRAVLAEIVLARADIMAGRMQEARTRIDRARESIAGSEHIADQKAREAVANLEAALAKLDGVLHNIQTGLNTPKPWRPSLN